MAKKKFPELECCGDSKECTCKPLKVYFCPKCKSHEVAYIFELRNIYGLLPKMKCKKCGYESMSFPILEINKNMLRKK